MANAMAVAITISALSSSFRDENKSTGLTRGFIASSGIAVVFWMPSRGRRLESVAHAMHGADGIGTELMAQRLDVAVDGAGADASTSPRLFEQLFAGEHDSGGGPAWPADRTRWGSDAPVRRSR